MAVSDLPSNQRVIGLLTESIRALVNRGRDIGSTSGRAFLGNEMETTGVFVIANGKTYPLPEPRTLAALLSSLSPSTPFAVARNEELVARGTYDECRIEDGDRIDIVHPTAEG